MQALIAFWSYALCAAAFLGLLIWRLSAIRNQDQRLLLAGFAVTACWAWLSAILPGDPIAAYAETARNLIWIGLIYSLSATSGERQHGVRLVYAAVAAVLGFQLVVTSLRYAMPTSTIEETATLLRITAAAGSLVLVHNLYGQASPASRSSIRLAMLALSLTWSYDLNLYTIAYLDNRLAPDLFEWRGAIIAATAPMFAMAANREGGWRIRLSRAATFQSLSLLAICAYFAVMSILAAALGRSGIDWSRPLLAALLAAMVVAAMVLLPSPRARSWVRVKLAKHFFEHRYDYRAEWLRFAATVGGSGSAPGPLGERLVKAFADIVEAPGGLLLAPDDQGGIAEAAAWNWPGRPFAADALDSLRWHELETRPKIVDLDALRRGESAGGSALPLPPWLADDATAWAGVPLVHGERMVGLVLLAAPEPRRALDWEDFDLLKTAGRQAASTLAEQHGQAALARAQRFDEFNRRFAFIIHDIKNLVSQLSLVARNAERHADNPEFRADMLATLQSSVGKMNALLARLGPSGSAREAHVEPVAVRSIVAAAIAGMRARHDLELAGDGNRLALADPLLLEQAIGHLVQNAIDASAEGAPVTVRMDGDDNGVSIAVIDHGCGMDAEFVRNRLFEPFASTKPGGFGVGAFEARSLVQAMGGRLTVDSRPGEGSRFTIHLAAAGERRAQSRKTA